MHDVLIKTISDNIENVFHLDPQLDAFIKQHATEPFYFSRAWIDLIAKIYGYTMIPLTTRDTTGQISGYLPIYSIKSILTGQRFVSLPFSDSCQILAVDEASANNLIDQAVQLAQKQKTKYLELRTGINHVFIKRTDFKEGNLYVRWLMPLATDPNDVWSELRKPVQKRIKKAERSGVQVRLAQNREDMAHFYKLHLLTRSKKHGMPAQSRRFFFELWDAFAGSGALQLLLAEYQGKIIASMILLVSGSSVKAAYSASDESFLNIAPNNLLFWTAITWACKQGYQTLDLGRTARDNEGLMEFKKRWGAIEEPVPYYYYPKVIGLAATSESSWKFRLLTNCWKRLPLGIAESLGGYFYKHLG